MPKPNMADILQSVTAPAEDPNRHGRRKSDMRDGEYSGGDVDYYRVFVEDPKRTDPYMAECEDLIEAMNMTFAEGCAFKAIWRKAAMRTLGHKKRGADEHGLYDAQKVEYYGKRQVVQAQRQAKKKSAEINAPVSIQVDGDTIKGFTPNGIVKTVPL